MLVNSSGHVLRPQRAGQPNRSRVARLDHRDVDRSVDIVLVAEDDGLVPQPGDDELEEHSDVVVGLVDEDPRHESQDRRSEE